MTRILNLLFYFINQLPTVLMTVTSSEPRIATQKLATLNPSKNDAVNQNSAPFITKMKSPSVTKVSGNVKKTKTGRTNTFITPKTKAPMTAGYKPSTSTPGRILATINNASAVIRIRAISFICT